MKLKVIKQRRKIIPKCNFKCKNCHECCDTPIAMSSQEFFQIQKFLKKNKIKFPQNNQNTCPYYNPEKMRCMVYPVRPLVCRLFGLESGRLACSKNKDKVLFKFMEFSVKVINREYLNSMRIFPEINDHFSDDYFGKKFVQETMKKIKND